MKKLFIILIIFITPMLFAESFLEGFYLHVNDYRESLGLTRLVPDDRVEHVADSYSSLLSEIGWLDHNALTSGEFYALCSGYGVYDAFMGEVLAAFDVTYTPYKVFLMFKNSPKHNDELIEPDAKYIGAGYFIGIDRVYFTAYIVTPKITARRGLWN